MTRPLLAILVVAFAMVTVPLGGATPALAQQPAAEGVVRGRVTMGSTGAVLEGAIEVEMIILEETQATGSVKAPVKSGTYEIRLPVVESRTYIPRLGYLGVNYFGDPVRFSSSESDVIRDFTVYATTDRANSLRLIQTIVTVIGIDPLKGQLALLREDVMSLGGDRVYIGGPTGITLRIPVPAGTTEASEEDGNGALGDGVLSVSTPIRPGAAASIITSTYRVTYDPAVDRYRLRVTVPVGADAVVVRVPRDYVHGIRPVAPAVKADNQIIQDEDRTVLLIVRTPGRVEAGQSLLVDIDGISGTLQQHPLTEQPGASIAVAAAAAVFAGSGVLLWRRRETAR